MLVQRRLALGSFGIGQYLRNIIARLQNSTVILLFKNANTLLKLLDQAKHGSESNKAVSIRYENVVTQLLIQFNLFQVEATTSSILGFTSHICLGTVHICTSITLRS